MNIFHNAEYAERVMAAVEIIHNALGETEFDVGTNALMTVLAQCGRQSTLTTEEFLTATVAQMKRLMDNMTAAKFGL